MDYKEKFEDFLNKMQGLLENAEKQGHIIIRVEDLENAFPELAESEDEKIRKWIINEIKIKHHNLDEDNVDFVDKAIAWLENIPYTIDHEKREGFHLGYKAALEKQGEQNDSYVKDYNSIDPHFGKPIDKVEQKPTEWSEEDEGIMYTIIRDLKRLGGDIVNVKPAYKAEIDWLKSLKERYTWKPSDEQMKQLGWIAEQNKDNMIGKELISLYQDLKKLREE